MFKGVLKAGRPICDVERTKITDLLRLLKHRYASQIEVSLD
jgi:hypothetical protein